MFKIEIKDLLFAIGLSLFAFAVAWTAYTAIQQGRQIKVMAQVIQTQETALLASERLREADRRAISQREEQLSVLRDKKVKQDEEINRLLREHSSFATTPVPDAIRQRLLD